MGLFVQGLFADGLFAAGLFAGDDQAVEITTSELEDGILGEIYVTYIQVDGVAPFTFSVTNGALPTGLALNAVSGQITGILEVEGTFGFTIEATNAFGSDEQAYVFRSLGFAADRAIFQLRKTGLINVEGN